MIKWSTRIETYEEEQKKNDYSFYWLGQHFSSDRFVNGFDVQSLFIIVT